MKKSILPMILVLSLVFLLTGCTDNTADRAVQEEQERLNAEANDAVGLPSITNWREKRIVKDLYELRDQEDLTTYTYIYSQMLAKFAYVGITIGYGIPYATQYSNPEKITYAHGSAFTIPQGEPNGLFSPASAEGTWIMMYDSETKTVTPAYIEERISVFTSKLPDRLVIP